MFKSSPRASNGPNSPGLLLFVIPLAFGAPSAALQAGAPDAALPATSSPEAPSEARVARELARLDDRLGLEAFADGSGLWTARLAATLELRLRTTGAPLHDMMRRLAIQLRALGVERPLGGVPQAAAEEVDPPGPERAEHLRRILATLRLLHEKLDRLERPEPESAGPTTLAAPGNDDCPAATSIGEGTFTGSTAEATTDGSSTCGDTGSSPDVWFRYTAAEAGEVTFDTVGSSYDTVLSVHTGCPAEGRDVELACNDDSGGTLQSAVTLGMASGEQVWIRISGSSGASGSFELNVDHFQGLAGTITREGTGEALSGATVELFDDFGFVQSVTTDAGGAYAFDGLADGTYFIRAESDGLIDALYDDIACPFFTSCNPRFDGTPVNLSGAATGIDVALEPGNAISGTVTDAASGDPVAAVLELYSEGGSFLHSVAADADGTYELVGLPAGTYHLTAASFNHRNELYEDLSCQSSCDVTTGTPLEVSGGVTLSGVDFALERLGAIEGTIVDESTGNSLTSQRVVAFDSSGSFVGSAFTNGNGDYRIGSLDAGDHFVRTDSFDFQDELYDDLLCVPTCNAPTGTPIPVALDSTTTGIDFALLRLAEIRGTVTHTVTGDPVANLRVRALNESGFSAGTAFTGTDGSYVLDRLADGTYTVATDSDLYRDELYDDVPCDGPCVPSAGTPVMATAGTITSGIDLALDRLGRILGRVVEAGDDVPISSFVVAHDTSGTAIRSDRSSFDGGEYAIAGLPPGTYFVKTSFSDFSDSGYQDELFDDVPCEPSCDLSEGFALPVVLNGSILGVDFALTPCPADSFAEIRTTLYLSTHTEEACERLSAGTDTTVASGADVTFKAGRSVVLEDGFSVQPGAAFRIVLEPEWTED